MRAAVIREYNQPWVFEERPEPEPGPGQVVIRVEASGLCGTDVHLHEGHMPFVPMPVVAGHEPVGRVAAVGAGVTDLRVGDRVGVSWFQKGCGRCATCQRQEPAFCSESQSWVSLGGGNQELMLAWASGCTLVPEGVSSAEAAPLFCAGYTVMSGLQDAEPQPGERVAVLGVGGLGHLGLQLAKALGHEVVAITSRDDKRAALKEMGADEVVLAGEHVGQSLMAAGGADIILSTTSSPDHVGQALAGLRPDGRLVNLGALHGPVSLDTMQLMFPPRRIIGSTQRARTHLVDALDLVASGKVKPMVETYPIDKINEVRDRVAAGKVRYRAVLTHGAS